MSTRMYFNYDNDKQVYVLPSVPEEIQASVKGVVTSISIDMFGEALHKGKRENTVYKFSHFFPAIYSPLYCQCTKKEFKSPKVWCDWIYKLLVADGPCHFVVTGSAYPINVYVDINSFQPREIGGDPGTLWYSIEMKEARIPTVRKYKKKVTANATKVTTTEKKRVNNAATSNKYRCTAGIGLNLRTGPWGTILSCIPYGTVVTTDWVWNGSWLHVNYAGIWGYACTSYLVKC